MALVRKTGKLKDQIEGRIDNVMHDKIKSILEKSEVETILHTMFQLGWENDYLLPRNMRDLANELRDGEDSDLLCGYAPIEMRFAVFRPEEYSWNALLTIKTETTKRYPIVTRPRMCFEHPEQRIAMAYGACPEYGELTPKHHFNVGLMFDKILTGGFDDTTKAYKMITRTQPRASSGYTTQRMKSTKWATVLNSDALTKYQPEQMKLNYALLEQLDLCNEIYVAIQKVIDRFDKTRSYIFGELWQLPSLNKMYEFFPGIRAFLTESTLKQLERGSRKRPQYTISAPDQDVIVGATEASIK